MSLQLIQRLQRATAVRALCSIATYSPLPMQRCFSVTSRTQSTEFKQERISMTAPIANWNLATQYVELPAKEKATFVPKTRGPFTDPKTFLTAIGRGCDSYADKFKSWEHLFTVTADQMEKELGVKCTHRKYIMGWREWYKRGIDPYPVEIPKRQKKYLKSKAKVQLARLKRQGLA
ncbi:uncharacterized protein SPPG_08017 [Spizellomyces punctatus DAOM BR117]|uniref:Small ribosomal subunit protein mS41 n=1 Tax=Spizellomyces punctatus (strain DAOM BR117) TaxID=645134 RepID=A0A0L0H7E3_SPIPD|nr:uncharacterized protein SPPG_08017 [Spizellomyces punctatus DAOM BR117]KNC96816.1 hypothetical protein SPPG_08017 [Spizellomyces punctatus DAOM BR117]|eukprot:XP_016604856.1 hypothetical protein SPPG_08017 [Spizellomyces punctatus DAOM BR117]